MEFSRISTVCSRIVHRQPSFIRVLSAYWPRTSTGTPGLYIFGCLARGIQRTMSGQCVDNERVMRNWIVCALSEDYNGWAKIFFKNTADTDGWKIRCADSPYPLVWQGLNNDECASSLLYIWNTIFMIRLHANSLLQIDVLGSKVLLLRVLSNYERNIYYPKYRCEQPTELRLGYRVWAPTRSVLK